MNNGSSSESVLFVVSGPGGVGKTSLVTAWMEAEPDLLYTKSVTTRELREKLANYDHIPEKTFLEMLERDEFVKWINRYGEYFGTLHQPIRQAITEGKDMVFDYCPEGYLNLKRYYRDHVIGIFVMAPSVDVMRERLLGRGAEHSAEREIRYQMALQDFDFVDFHEYHVVNDDFDTALAQLRAIRVAEKARVSRKKEIPFRSMARKTLLRYYDVPQL
ncbi:MAG: guanylate kinase [bacterium]|nr:guanylate kinase [bacterium]